jgi:hypothetical protein
MPVAPVLKFGDWDNQYMYGLVKTSFANPDYQMANCKNPIQVEPWATEYYDAQDVGQTCMTIDDAAQSFYTYQQYLSTWGDLLDTGNGTNEQQFRPAPVALFLQNTTVNGTWIDIINTTAVSKSNNRVINNITLAMPHIGVFQAARDPLSNIMQPEVCSQAVHLSCCLVYPGTRWLGSVPD